MQTATRSRLGSTTHRRAMTAPPQRSVFSRNCSIGCGLPRPRLKIDLNKRGIAAGFVCGFQSVDQASVTKRIRGAHGRQIVGGDDVSAKEAAVRRRQSGAFWHIGFRNRLLGRFPNAVHARASGPPPDATCTRGAAQSAGNGVGHRCLREDVSRQLLLSKSHPWRFGIYVPRYDIRCLQRRRTC